MKQFKIPEWRLDAAKKIASQHNVMLVVSESSYDEALDTNFVQISVELPQPENVPVLVAYAHVDGDRHAFTNDWTWTEANINTVEFGRCDRCHTDRNRTKLFIVKIDNKLIQVGGYCAIELNCELKMHQLLKLRCAVEEELTEEDCCYNGSSAYTNVDDYLKAAAVIVKRSGYVSKKAAELDPDNKLATVNEVNQVLSELDTNSRNEWKDLVNSTLTEEEKQVGYWTAKCMKHLNAQEFNEYIHNCKIAIITGKIKLLGFAVSAVGQVIKVEREASAKFVRTTVPVSGDKIQVNGKIVRLLEAVGYYGEHTTKVTIDDQSYGKVWFQTTANWISSAKEGDSIKCLINVKEVKDNIIFAKRASKIEINEVAVK